MKIEKIANNKLKITLEYQDMVKWDLDYESLPKSMPGPGDLFWDILRIAEEETGILFENCKLTVEAMQRAGGAFVMFITKGELDKDEKPAFLPRKYTYKKRCQDLKKQSILVFMFKSIDDISTYGKIYKAYGIIFDNLNSIYKYGGGYYLSVEIPAELSEHTKGLINSLREYAKREPKGEIFIGRLKEYGQVLIENNGLREIEKI